MTFVERTAAAIEAWHGIAPPNDAAMRMLAAMDKIIHDFEKARGTLRFEDEPSSFEVALLEAAEPWTRS